MMSLRRRPSLAVFLAMLAVLLIFTYPLCRGDRLLFMGDITTSDVTELNFPSRYLLSTSLREGTLPLWNPFIGCGFPLHAEGQSGLLYPLNLLLFRLLGTTLAFNLSVILSLLLCLAFSYLLSRFYGLSRPSSLYAATAFTFSGFVMSKVKFTYMVNSIPWMPLAIFGLEKSFSAKNLKFLLLASVALAMQLLAGGPQIFFITLVLLFLIFCWRLAHLPLNGILRSNPGRKRLVAGLLVGFLLSVLLGMALAAPQLLPQTAGFPYFNRAHGESFYSILATPMQPGSLSLFFSPYQNGNPAYGTYDLNHQFFWEDIAYPGLLTMVLGLVAIIFLLKKGEDIGMWLILSVLALLIALGGNTPLAEFLYRHVPGFNMFRFYQRFMLITVMGLALLAGKGFDLLLSSPRWQPFWRTALTALVLAVLVLDLGLFTHRQLSTIETDRMLSPGEVTTFLKETTGNSGDYRYSTLGENEAWEQAYRQAGGWMGRKDPYYEYFAFLPPNFNSIFGISGAQQYGAYGLASVKMFWGLTYYGKVKGAGWERDLPDCVLGALAVQSVRYIVTPYVLNEQALELLDSKTTGVEGMNLNLYQLREALPRASIFSRYEVVADPDTLTLPQFSDLLIPLSRLQERVILDSEPEHLFDEGSGRGGEARITSSTPNKVTVEADVPEGGILVLNDAYYPEWHAYVDGREREVMRANLAFRAVVLEPGHHEVVFVFRPTSLYHGMLIGAAGIALIALVLLRHRRTAWLDLSTP